jgi:hypothetical protein
VAISSPSILVADAALAAPAVKFVNSFYPDVRACDDQGVVTLSSASRSEAELRAIWGAAIFSEKSATKVSYARANLLEDLFL